MNIPARAMQVWLAELAKVAVRAFLQRDEQGCISLGTGTNLRQAQDQRTFSSQRPTHGPCCQHLQVSHWIIRPEAISSSVRRGSGAGQGQQGVACSRGAKAGLLNSLSSPQTHRVTPPSPSSPSSSKRASSPASIMSSSASSAPTPSSSSRRLFFALAFRLVRLDAAAYCSSSIAAVEADRLCPAPLPLPDPDDLDPDFFEAPGATAGLLEPRLPLELVGGLMTVGDAVLERTRGDELNRVGRASRLPLQVGVVGGWASSRGLLGLYKRDTSALRSAPRSNSACVRR